MIFRMAGSKAKNGITSCQALRQAGAMEAYFPAHFSLKAFDERVSVVIHALPQTKMASVLHSEMSTR